MDTAQYLKLLGEMSNSRPSLQVFRFVHDHHPEHSARIVKQWIRDNIYIDVLPWPKNFGFVMPMENIWSDVVLKLKGTSVSSTEELWNVVNCTFRQLCSDPSYLNNLCDGIPSKLKSIVEKNSLM